MINFLTIDLEDYYQVSAFESVVKREDWDRYESRLERNTYRLLEILEEAYLEPQAASPSPPTSSLQPPTFQRQPFFALVGLPNDTPI